MTESARVTPPPPWSRRVLWRALGPAARLFDAIERAWERPRTQHALGLVLVAAFVAALVAVEAARRGWLPATVGAWLPHSHFWAVDVAFTLLLVLELVAFVLARSVGESVAKQFQLLALILLRKAILEVAHVGEPIAWRGAATHVPVTLADMAAALAVFVLAESPQPGTQYVSPRRTSALGRPHWPGWSPSNRAQVYDPPRLEAVAPGRSFTAA